LLKRKARSGPPRRGVQGMVLARLVAALLTVVLLQLPAFADREPSRLSRIAERIEIVRDDWGVAHIRAATDADAVFGMMYAQAEDDFNRIEMNYVNMLGRRAELDGETFLYQDLRARMYAGEGELRALYARSPSWLQALMKAWADGLNFYLSVHPDVRPRLITRFEPWMPLAFSEGSIGGDIERISANALRAFYESSPAQVSLRRAGVPEEPGGSNGFALSAARSASGAPLLLINPHTSFYFRAEQHVTSGQGLNAYGAATWGQFFIYQGFNASAGWMHTSSGVDAVDEFLLDIVPREGKIFYRHGQRLRPLTQERVRISYRTPQGGLEDRTFTIYRSHHGPVIRKEGDAWVSIALMHRPVEALSQSFLRTKSRDFRAFERASAFAANSSNNTIFADRFGTIAYLHPQFIPKRSERFDYSRPVDGGDPDADWGRVHRPGEIPRIVNPSGGWIQNTNNWPYSAAGSDSPDPAEFPSYMDTAGENARGLNAVRILSGNNAFTLDSLVAAAYDPFLPAFAELIPSLTAAFDTLRADDPLHLKLAPPAAVLSRWDYRWGADSVATSLAVFWAEDLLGRMSGSPPQAGASLQQRMVSIPPSEKLAAFAQALDRLEKDFGSWNIPWGEINRFQRLDGSIEGRFSDDLPSTPVPFVSSQWGSLAAFGSRAFPGVRRYYGYRGNSFVAVVEFGEKVRARAVLAGGASGNPASTHFDDQIGRYARGDLREVYFHPEDLAGHVRVRYRPGERWPE